MNRERAETHLRLLAEAELRHTTALRADGTMSQRHVPSLALAAQVLSAVGAVDVGTVDEIRHDLDLALAARLLTVAATFPQDTPEELADAQPGLVPHPAANLGDIIAALQAADALSPASPGPGQLAGLCASLGVSGHGITAPPDGNLPEPWRSMLTRYHRRQPQTAPQAGGWAATAAQLPELDGARVAVLGLHHSEDGTILHVQASGVTPEDDWAYYRGARPLPALWIRDSSGRWHTTRLNGYSPARDAGEVMLYPAIVPPLDSGTAWIDVLAAGQSAEVRARLPLRWN